MTNNKMSSAFDDQGLENKLITLALKQAENQLKEQTASSQIVTHFLKLGSHRAEVELQKLKLENLLIEEKILAEKSGQHLNEMLTQVLAALKSYVYVPPGADDADIF